MDEVDDYLWEVYQRAPVKRDGSGDFTWKYPAAAKRFGLAMPAYVIGGMAPGLPRATLSCRSGDGRRRHPLVHAQRVPR